MPATTTASLNTLRNVYDDGAQVAVTFTDPNGAPKGGTICIPDHPDAGGPQAYVVVEPAVLVADRSAVQRARAERNSRPSIAAGTTIVVDGIAYRVPADLGRYSTTRLARR